MSSEPYLHPVLILSRSESIRSPAEQFTAQLLGLADLDATAATGEEDCGATLHRWSGNKLDSGSLVYHGHTAGDNAAAWTRSATRRTTLDFDSKLSWIEICIPSRNVDRLRRLWSEPGWNGRISWITDHLTLIRRRRCSGGIDRRLAFRSRGLPTRCGSRIRPRRQRNRCVVELPGAGTPGQCGPWEFPRFRSRAMPDSVPSCWIQHLPSIRSMWIKQP